MASIPQTLHLPASARGIRLAIPWPPQSVCGLLLHDMQGHDPVPKSSTGATHLCGYGDLIEVGGKDSSNVICRDRLGVRLEGP